MPRNNSIVGTIIGLVFFLGFGVFFIFGWGSFRSFSIIPIFPMIFVIVIFGIVVAANASSRRSTCCSPKSNNQYKYTQEVPRSNPYLVKTSSSSTVRPIYIEDAEPEIQTANYCQYCGSKKDRNAKFCYNCGTKL